VPAWTRGLGLAGMEERAAILNAKLDLWSRPGNGTVINLTIPPAPTLGDAALRPTTRLANAKSTP
jgi:glucose-6-phosphate-specific signal transduction histidine kinase